MTSWLQQFSRIVAYHIRSNCRWRVLTSRAEEKRQNNCITEVGKNDTSCGCCGIQREKKLKRFVLAQFNGSKGGARSLWVAHISLKRTFKPVLVA